MSKKIGLFFMLTLALVCIKMGADGSKSFSLSGGMGLGNAFGKFSYQVGHHVFSLRAGYTFDVFSEHSNDNKDFGLHYSYCFTNPEFFLRITLGLGIAVTHFEKTDKVYVGFPLEAQILIRLSPYFYAGVYYFDNYNSFREFERFRGIGLSLHLEFKRR